MKEKQILKIIIVLFISLTLFTCRKKEIDVDITKHKWEVKSIKKSGQAFSDKAKNNYILEFTNDTVYNLSLDKNNCFEIYEILTLGKIEFENPSCTEVCCDSEFAKSLTNLMVKVTDYYVVDGDILTLVGGDERIKLKKL